MYCEYENVFFFYYRYDLYSVTHYNQYAFSKTVGKPSIKPKDTNFRVDSMGQRFGLSKTDTAKINAAYVRKKY